MSRDEMTERILRAMDDPHVTFLGHLTGRKLLTRDGYTVELRPHLREGSRKGRHHRDQRQPYRLDVDWRYLGRAVEMGCLLSIHPDAHSIAELSHVISGTWVARKAGLPAKAIFNTRSADEVAEYLDARKG
jgi:DNA polymerase (family 10)